MDAIRDILTGGGWTLEIRATEGPGDARRFAEAIRGNGQFDVVVCHGGDGTAMQVAAGLVGTGVPLGLVPGGTGNVLAGNLGLPRGTAAAARALLAARARAIDVGVVERADGPHYFAVAAGTGFDAQLMADTGLAAKRRWKVGAYVGRALLTLSQVTSVPHHVTVDGAVHEVQAAMLLVLNCGRLPPGFLPLRASLDPADGWLDVLALRADGAFQSAAAVLELLTRVAWPESMRRVWWARGRTVRVELAGTAAPPPLARPVQLDGEVTGTTPFEARLLPGGLTVLVDRSWKKETIRHG